MDNLCKKLMLGGSTAAMFAALSAGAQAQEQAPAVENVEVSASRIQIQGYEAPTPVTVIGAETLQRDAKVDLGDAIRELPAVGQSDSPSNGSHSGNASQGDAGIDTVDLRSLGVVRTLVLFDGQRVVTSNPNAGGPPAIGGVDLSTIPTSVIQRIDVVTGGASASWGSDAVAGVVNLVIDKTYTGFKANATFGNDKYDDQKKYKFEVTAGTDFLGGRGHTEFAGTYTMSPDAMYNWNRPWYDSNNRALYPCSVVNGGSATALCHTPAGVYTDSFTNGGLITASAASATGAALAKIQGLGGQFATAGSGAASAANVLKGIQFVGPNAQQVPFNFGTNSGSNCYNCSGNPNTDVANAPLTAVPYHNYTLFNYTSYKITPDITASVMLNYGWNAEENQANNGRQSQLAIPVDNAFIPAALQQQMIASGIPSLTLGTAAMENLQKTSDVSFKNLGLSLAQNFVQNYRQLMRGVFTLTGNYHLFGEEWSWNAYAQNSSVRERQYAPYNTMNTNFANAVDSVVVQANGPDSLGGGNAATAAQVKTILGAAGVPIPAVGSIACRSTLTATAYGVTTSPTSGFQTLAAGGLAPGCVPLNVFGDGTVSQAAQNYVAPGRINAAVEDQALYRIGQSVFSVSTQGVLPWGLAAGKPAVSFGFEDRLEQQRNTRDPLQLGASGVFESGNFSQYAGQYNVQEGYLEVDVPLLKNDFVDDLNFNGAGRITSYSTSGLVETWKLGLTSQVNEDIKLRTTLSSDIRAPGIGELFTNTLVSTQTLAFPNGGPTFNVHQLQGGNPLLVPEQAETVEGGIVLTPHWIENLSMSFDWYSITLHNGIFAPSESQIAAQCAGGVKLPQFCSLLFFAKGFPGNSSLPVAAEVDGNGASPPPALLAAIGNTTFSADSEGAFNAYLQAPVNANRETTSGLDFQLDYQHELFAGVMNWHILGNYTDEKTRTSLGVTVDGAGAVSADGGLNPLGSVFLTDPKLRATITSTYTEGPWSLTAQARVIGSAVLSNNITQSQSAFTSIDNNNVPAVIYGDFRGSYRWNDHIQLYGAIDNAFNAPPPNLPTVGGGGTNCIIYDCIGRSYRIGVRFDD
jgi:iron complex outermembrane receptor protein